MPDSLQGLNKQAHMDLLEGKWMGEWKQNEGTDWLMFRWVDIWMAGCEKR